MSYTYLKAIYGRVLPSEVVKWRLRDIVCKLINKGIINQEYESTSIWVGVPLGEFDECVDYYTSEQIGIVTATPEQLAAAEVKLSRVPKVVLCEMTPVGYYYVVGHS